MPSQTAIAELSRWIPIGAVVAQGGVVHFVAGVLGEFGVQAVLTQTANMILE